MELASREFQRSDGTCVTSVFEQDDFSPTAGSNAGKQDLHERVVEQCRPSIDDAGEVGRLGYRTTLQGYVFSDEADHRGG